MTQRVFRKIYFLILQLRIQGFKDFNNSFSTDAISPEMFIKNQEILRPYYERYVKEISRADMAASLELAAFMLTICNIRHYTKLLDMGSGLSSFVFRFYAKQNPGVVVFSVDDDATWLLKTKSFLQEYQLNIENILTLDQFLNLDESNFDCILHDLNFVEVRINYVEALLQRISRNGLIIFDDVHKPDYQLALLKKLRIKGGKIFDLKEATLDSFGRFALGLLKR